MSSSRQDDLYRHRRSIGIPECTCRAAWVALGREALLGPAGDTPTVDEAWAAVQAAVARHGYTAAWADNWDGCPAGLHPLVARLVRNIGWSTLCESDNPTALRAHFGRWWDEALRHEQDLAVMPHPLAPTAGALERRRGEPAPLEPPR